MSYPNDYDYIARTYGIRPRYGERVRSIYGRGEGTVKRERKSCAQYVVVLYDGEKHPVVDHPRAVIYIEREEAVE